MRKSIQNLLLPDNTCYLDSTNQFAFKPDNLVNVMTYNGPSGALDTITVGPDANGNSFRQTLTYTGTNVTRVSAWIKV